ncbi:MAG: helix-turn-helix domain-containing protein [Gemmatimonadales bacterium]|nr:MAG: helix-turn-helix domain-containing protein [Gemmatimonadales bacterium]
MQAYNSELFLTTSEAAELLGVHPSTVKRWTDADELESEKTEGGHRRLYLRSVLGFAGDRGIATYLAPFEPFESHVWLAVRDAVRHDDFERMVSLSLGWLLRGYPKRITALLQELGGREDLSFARVCDGLIRPFMKEVGTAWREGRLRIGEEHMASQAIVEALIRLTTEPLARSGPSENGAEPPPLALVGAMEGDEHHLGALCVRILLEREGWNVHYLGPNTPAEEFATFQRRHGASLVCISFSPPARGAKMRRCLDILSAFYRADEPYDLVFGGGAAGAVHEDAEEVPFRTFRIFDGAESFAHWIRHRSLEPSTRTPQ